MTISLELIDSVLNNQLNLVNKHAPNELQKMINIWSTNNAKILTAKQYILSDPLVLCYIKLNREISYQKLYTKPSIGSLFILWFDSNIGNFEKNIIKVFNTIPNNQIEKYSQNKKSADALLKILNNKDDRK